MEQVHISHFYIEANEEGEGVLYAVEEVGGPIQGPPRIYNCGRVNEFNYR